MRQSPTQPACEGGVAVALPGLTAVAGSLGDQGGQPEAFAGPPPELAGDELSLHDALALIGEKLGAATRSADLARRRAQ